jgi:DNA polymerase-3 subunit beta
LKIICEKNELVNAISIVQKAVPSKTTYPILQGILLRADETLELTGNDLEIGIECIIDAEIYEKGEVIIDSRIFGEIIRRMPNTKVNIEKDENENIIITCKNSRFEIKGTKGESFPRIPEIKREKSLKVCQAVIKDMISQTIFAVGEDENRPILNGVNIESKNGLLTFVAIDGFRLALRKYIIEDVDADINVVVPGKTLSEIAKILEPTDEDVTIYVAENQIMFDMGNTKVVSRLLEGEYFNYENVIPDEYETKILINRKEFLDSIERASILISSDGTRYPINIALKHDKMIITTNTNIGSAREEIKIEVEGNDIEAKFNPRYFIEALKEIDEENIDVSFNSDVGPCIIKSVDKDTFVYMLLPLRK